MLNSNVLCDMYFYNTYFFNINLLLIKNTTRFLLPNGLVLFNVWYLRLFFSARHQK